METETQSSPDKDSDFWSDKGPKIYSSHKNNEKSHKTCQNHLSISPNLSSTEEGQCSFVKRLQDLQISRKLTVTTS